MPAQVRRIASLWLPPVIWMALIFVLSAQQDLNSGLGVVDLVARKLVHAGEYALLCVLWWRALRTVATRRVALGGALVLAVLYGGSDELHQTFVPTREGAPLDVLIDTVGATLAAILIWRRTHPTRGREPEPDRAAPPSRETTPVASREATPGGRAA
jgi:VanZ family protein